MSYTDLDPSQAALTLDGTDRPLVLDVRTGPEHASHRIAGAVLLPVQELHARLDEVPASPNGYLVVCEHGVRSVAACGLLAEAGHGPLFNLRGGMARWIAEGHDHQRGG